MSLFLIRHASAGHRGHFQGDDLDRPLDEQGRDEAVLIASQLADTPMRAVWSSIATRCVQTVAPLAAACGLEVITRRQLTEGARPSGLLGLVRREASNQGNVTMCSHGDLIPDVINALLRDGLSVLGPRGCEKASIWELHTHDGIISHATYTARLR